MQTVPIQKFGTKLMSSNKALNATPPYFLQVSQNGRIYDGGIWPRRGKIGKYTEATYISRGIISIKNRLFIVRNQRLMEIDLVAWTSTDRGSVGHDEVCNFVTYGIYLLIFANGQTPIVFNTATNAIAAITTVPAWGGYWGGKFQGFTFTSKDNILYISRPIDSANQSYCYDRTTTSAPTSQNISLDGDILGGKGGLNRFTIFTTSLIYTIDKSSLAITAGSAALTSTPVGEGGELLHQNTIVLSGDKVFYWNKNLQVKTVYYRQWINDAAIGELSDEPVIGMNEFIRDMIDPTQPCPFWFLNSNDNTIQWHLKPKDNAYNTITIVYDIVNETWDYDIGKNYNGVTNIGRKYYWVSTFNSDVFEDDIWYNDDWVPFKFWIRTSPNNFGNLEQKNIAWMWISGIMRRDMKRDVKVDVDEQTVYSGEIDWLDVAWISPWGIGTTPIWVTPIWSDEMSAINANKLFSWDRTIDQADLRAFGKRVVLDFSCISENQEWLIDVLQWKIEWNANFTSINDRI